MSKFNWECPFCHHKSVVFDGDEGTVRDFTSVYYCPPKYERVEFHGQFIGCPNEKCGEFSLFAKIVYQKYANGGFKDTDRQQFWGLIPQSSAKIMPDFIPAPLRNDYVEACVIRDLSPKASATLSRRCLQGMIRDFWGISKKRLVDEIEALETMVDQTTWEAIDSMRKLGNIGAHMEANINVIVEVDPGEAQLLIEVIEILFDEWYVAKHNREEKMTRIKAMAEAKKPPKPSGAPTEKK